MTTLSPEEVQKRYGNNFKVINNYSQPEQSRGQETLQDIKQVGSNIKNRFIGGADKIAEIKSSEQGIASSALQTFGAGAGAFSGAVGDLITGIVKGTLSQEHENAVKTKVAEVTTSVLQNPAVKPVISQYVKAYKESSPETQRNLEGVFNIAMLATDVIGAGGAGTVAKKTFTKLGDVATDVAKQTFKAGEKVASVATKAGAGVADYSTGRIPKLLGIFSGESDDVITAAMRNPKVARLGIESGDVALRKAVVEGATNSIKIKNAFIKGFSEAKNKVMGKYDKILIPKNNVKGTFNKLLKDNKVVIKNGKLDFTTSLIKANPGEIAKIKAAYEALKKWDKFTINSLDEYKRLVGSLTKFANEAGGSSKSPFLGKLYHELNEMAAKRLPKDVAKQYRSLSKKFSENIDLYDDLVKAFNSKDPFTKLSGALGKNKDSLRQLLEFYKKKGGQDIPAIVAGRELAMEKTAAFGFLNPRSWVDFFISPELQGKTILKVGEKLNKIK